MNARQMKVIVQLGLAGICLLLGTAANAAKPAKTSVCHVPEETPANVRSIEVGSKGTALLEHILHGDWEVNTEQNCDTIADNDCDGYPDDTADGDAFCVEQLGEGSTCNTDEGICVEPATTCPCEESWNDGVGAPPLNDNPFNVPIAVSDAFRTSCGENTTAYTYYNTGFFITPICVDGDAIPISNAGNYTPAEVQACKTLLEAAGCVFD